MPEKLITSVEEARFYYRANGRSIRDFYECSQEFMESYRRFASPELEQAWRREFFYEYMEMAEKSIGDKLYYFLEGMHWDYELDTVLKTAETVVQEDFGTRAVYFVDIILEVVMNHKDMDKEKTVRRLFELADKTIKLYDIFCKGSKNLKKEYEKYEICRIKME